MRDIFALLVQTPAEMIGELVAALWPAVVFAIGILVGWVSYHVLASRLPRKLAIAGALVVGVYATIVMHESVKWTGVALIRLHKGDL